MESTRAREIADSFKIRCSAIIDIIGEIGLTEKQEQLLATYTQRQADFKNGVAKVKDLTDNQKAELASLIYKRDNPELPDGAKTHCKKWIKGTRFNRWPEVKSKYIDKGNTTEEEGFTLMATELNIGMVYKNTERKSNDYLIGECDLSHNGKVYDNKSSYDLDTFPMFETEFDKKYWWQLNGYGILWNVEDLVLCHTLNDATEEMIDRAVKWTESHDERYKIVNRMVFTKKAFDAFKNDYFNISDKNYFVEIPDEERIKTFEFKKEVGIETKIEARVKMCREYIYNLLTK